MAVHIQIGGHKEGDTPQIETTYTGCVLQTIERNGYDDSDFLAIVWDETTQSLQSVTYATTRGWTYNNYAKVDATPEVIAKAATYYAARVLEVWKERNLREAQKVEVGKEVRVTRAVAKRTTRPVAKDEVGTVLRLEVDGYKSRRWGTVYSAFVQLEDEVRAWLPAEALEVLNPLEYVRPWSEGVARAERARQQTCWAALFEPSFYL